MCAQVRRAVGANEETKSTLSKFEVYIEFTVTSRATSLNSKCPNGTYEKSREMCITGVFTELTEN